MLDLLAADPLCPCCIYPFLSGSRGGGFGAGRRFACVATDAAASAVGLPGTWLTGLNLVDTADGSIVADVSLKLAGGRIVELAEGAPPRTGPGEQVVAADGKFVVPGYNDMHSHALELADPGDALALMLADGVTGFRQMSGSAELLRARRGGALSFGEAAPELLEMPGAVLTPLNADTAEKAVAEVDAQVALGADFIKVGFVNPEVLLAILQAGKENGIPVLGHLQEGLRASSAAELGFRSVEHLGPGITVWAACSRDEAALEAQSSPVRIKAPPAWAPFLRRLIEQRLQLMLINPAAFTRPAYTARLQHAIETFDEDRLSALAEQFVAHETWHVPTLVRLRTQALAATSAYDDHPFIRYMPARHVRRWQRVTRRFRKLPEHMRRTYEFSYPYALRLAKGLADRGVRMMAGTDGGWLSSPGLGMHDEFAELAASGFTPLSVLQMTTLHPAEYLRREDRMGKVSPGRNADLVLLNTNPLDAVRNLADIHAVIRAGRIFPHAELDGMRERVARNAKLH